jgi:hypothetical protein
MLPRLRTRWTRVRDEEAYPPMDSNAWAILPIARRRAVDLKRPHFDKELVEIFQQYTAENSGAEAS